MISPDYAERLVRRMAEQAIVPAASDNVLSDADFEALRERLLPAIAEAVRPIVEGQS